jgi:acyl-CoA thioester hydrolase
MPSIPEPSLITTVEPRFIDRMGHMNIEWYTHFFQKAIWNFYEGIGFGVPYHKQSGFGSFLLESHYVYLKELREGKSFSIFMRLLPRREKVFHYLLYMQRDEDNALAATMESTGIHIDFSTRRGAPMPTDLAERWDQATHTHSNFAWPHDVKTRLTTSPD